MLALPIAPASGIARAGLKAGKGGKAVKAAKVTVKATEQAAPIAGASKYSKQIVAAVKSGGSVTTKWRRAPGADQAVSRILKIFDKKGRTKKILHQVWKNGKLIHEDVKFTR